jgi:carbamoylphosphate synthase large subunit
MSYILAKKSKTAKLLGQELGIPVVSRKLADKGIVIPVGTVIRWGETRAIDGCSRQVNNIGAIKLTSDKAKCRQFLRENGIPVPKESETDFPVIGRTRFHTQGKGFFFCRNEIDVQKAKRKGAVYFAQYYPKQTEYRVHNTPKKVLLVSIKEGDSKKIIWNKRKSGFNFRHLRWSEIRERELEPMLEASKKALKLVGLDFGAIDIMADAKGDFEPFVVSEINTCPSLSPLAVSKYVKYFKKLL